MNSEDAISGEASDEKVATKRPYLEIGSELEKFKSVLINKPFETKRFKASDALDRVKQFLPSLKESTDKLLAECKENPDNVDIENCDDDEKVIEMNLQFVEDSDTGDSEEEDDDDEEECETDETGDEENPNEDENGDKVLDLNELISKEQENKEIKINSDIVFRNKSSSKKQQKKKPFIKIISNSEEDTTSQQQTEEENQPCTSESSTQ